MVLLPKKYASLYTPINVTERTLIPPGDFYPAQPGIAQKLLGVLIPRKEIKERVSAMAQIISQDYEGREIQPVVVMEGAKRFYDLLKGYLLKNSAHSLKSPILINAKSMDGVESRGLRIEVHKDSPLPLNAVEMEDCLIVEDIEDTCKTLSGLNNRLREYLPTSLHVVVLLRKVGVEKQPLSPDFVRYCGFEIANQFVVGLGLDYNGALRDLEHICVLHPDVYRGQKSMEAGQ